MAATKQNNKENSNTTSKAVLVKQITGLVIIFLSVFLFTSFIAHLLYWKEDQDVIYFPLNDFLFNHEVTVSNWMGKLGALAGYVFFYRLWGLASFIFSFMIFITGIQIFFNFTLRYLKRIYLHSVINLTLIPVLLALVLPDTWVNLAGYFGFFIKEWLVSVVGYPGSILILVLLYLSYVSLMFNIDLREKIQSIFEKIKNLFASKNPQESRNENIENISDNTPKEQKTSPVPPTVTPDQITKDTENITLDNSDKGNDVKNKESEVIATNQNPPSNIPEIISNEDGIAFELETTAEKEQTLSEEEIYKKILEESGEYDPTLDLPHYKFPTLDLLENYSTGNSQIDREELETNKKRIVSTLENYNIQIQSIKATIGPTVTLYEIVPAPGIRISKIKNLENDIALSLAALGIRIIAPIPGKGTIGIEVPNQNPQIVPMRSIIASDKFQNSGMELPLGLGKTISNETFVVDLAKMPHLLMAGATGQGKSVGINAILTSLLYKKHPSQLKFVLVDPKKVELTLYSKIERHFLAKLPDEEEAIITDTKKVINTLNSLCREMDMRYELLKDAQVRNIKEYNTKFIQRRLNPENGHRFLPYIVLVIDEFADLIMTAGKEIETPIARLAQLARAIGIHLIIATQRPSTNIITGIIKANFPARIAFRVSSQIDSRTILDSGGAEQLIGRGDMLISLGNDLIRLQCAFIDTHEVERVTDYIGSQRGYPSAMLLPECETESSGENGLQNDDLDDLFEEAARIIVETQQGSTSLIQRKLKIGYNRAGRIIDQLEAAGIIGPFEGSKARNVLVKTIEELEQLLMSIKNRNQ